MTFEITSDFCNYLQTPFFDFFYCTFLVYLHFVMYIINKVCKKIKTNSRSIDREQ